MHLSCLTASLDDAWPWQRRLGHASMHTLDKLAKCDLVRGLPPYNYGKDVCVVHVLSAKKCMC